MNNRSTNESGNRYSRGSRKLYKNPDSAKVCGVCSGIAEYFDLETWVVRLIGISFVLFSGGTAVIAYFFACFIMEAKPGSRNQRGCFSVMRRHSSRSADTHYSSEHRQYRASVKDVWSRGDAPTETLQKIETTFDNIENKLRQLETYVTSNKYQLDKEFQNMS